MMRVNETRQDDMGGGIKLGAWPCRRLPRWNEFGDFAALNDNPAAGVIGKDGKGIL